MEIATSIIAGIFAIVAGYLGWRLRMSEKNAAKEKGSNLDLIH